jgi:FAD:protein FMN transferase
MASREAEAHDPGIEFRAMNTLMAVIARTDSPHTYWQRPIIRMFAEVERTASRFIRDSELSRLNRTAPNQPVLVSSTLFQLLKTAWRYAVKTDYLFQPLIGSYIKHVGYDRSFELLEHSSPSLACAETEPYIVNESIRKPNALEFDSSNRTVTRHTDFELDLGGIGKGWSADRAVRLLRGGFETPSGLVDAGGDIFVWSDGDPWCIGIQHPEDEEAEVMQLWIKEAGIATSNVLHRRWSQNGQLRHHILDGRTGKPAQSDVVQATVLTHTASEAEVVAKILCMLGSRNAFSWVDKYFPQAAFVLITDSGNIIERSLSDYAIKVVG